MPKPKKKGDISQVFEFEIDTGEVEEFQWAEDHEPLPLVKPREKKKEGEEGESELA